MYNRQHTDQPHLQPGCSPEQQKCTPQTSPTTTDHHQPAAKHATQILTAMFQIAIQENIFELTAIDHLYNQNPAILQSNLEFYLYDHSNLNAPWDSHEPAQLPHLPFHSIAHLPTQRTISKLS